MQCKRIVLSAISGLVAVSFVTQAYATMSIPYGWYVEANAGSSHLSNKSYGSGSASSSGWGGNANLGYKFMPFLGLEIGYSQYAKTTIQTPSGPDQQKAAQDNHYSYGIWARGILPIADSGVELFGKLGAQRITSRVTIQNQQAANQIGIGASRHGSTGLFIGIGGQYYFYPEIAAVVQWQRAQGNSSTGTEDLYSIGFSFIFN